MQQMPVTWSAALRVFWLIFWRGFVTYMIVGSLLLYCFWWVAFYKLGIPGEQALYFSRLILLPLAIVPFAIATQMALKKHYRGFRIALVSDAKPVS
jgi:hypothetical protein